MPRKTHTIQAYTDGASSGNPGPGGWAALVGNRLLSGAIARCTNNYAELFAAWIAAEVCPKGRDLVISTDSQLVIGWLTGAYTIRHLHIAQIVSDFHASEHSNNLKVTFRKVKGHADDPLNNLVDQAARAASLNEKAAQAHGDTTVGLDQDYTVDLRKYHYSRVTS